MPCTEHYLARQRFTGIAILGFTPLIILFFLHLFRLLQREINDGVTCWINFFNPSQRDPFSILSGDTSFQEMNKEMVFFKVGKGVASLFINTLLFFFIQTDQEMTITRGSQELENFMRSWHVLQLIYKALIRNLEV